MSKLRYRCRGIDRETGKFVYGGYAERSSLIVDEGGEVHAVDPTTVGFYIGHRNAEGERIYTRDVFQAFDGVLAIIEEDAHVPYRFWLVLCGYVTGKDGRRRGHVTRKAISGGDADFLRTMVPLGNDITNPDWCPFYKELIDISEELYGKEELI